MAADSQREAKKPHSAVSLKPRIPSGHLINPTIAIPNGARNLYSRDDRGDHKDAARDSRDKSLRPRCFTSSANCRIDSQVIVRPSPRAREASAESIAVRISALKAEC